MGSPRGSFQVQTFGQILWITVTGAINRRFAETYRDGIMEAAGPLIDSPWIRITDIRGWQLGGPEVIPPLHDLMLWCEQHELSHSINIVSLPHLQTYMLNQMMANIPRRSVRHLVEDENQTLALIRQLGYAEEASAVETYLEQLK